ncbi:hypothetical protein BHE74_00024827 [Ensete ventricosum]|nr:hypothetical protein BHE74_00024827 [Ensete ventricosum]
MPRVIDSLLGVHRELTEGDKELAENASVVCQKKIETHLELVVMPSPPYFRGAFGGSTVGSVGSTARTPVLRKALNFGSNLKLIGVYKYLKFFYLEKQG